MASNSKTILLNQNVSATVTGDAVFLPMSAVDLIGFITVANRTGGTYTGKLEHSPDGNNWADLKAFTAISSNTSESQVCTGGACGWIRPVVTFGAGGVADVTISICYRESK